MRARLAVMYTTTADVGDIPLSAVQILLEDEDSGFNIWEVGDLSVVEIESVEVTEEEGGKSRAKGTR